MSYLTNIYNIDKIISDEGFKPEILSVSVTEYKDYFIRITTYKYFTYSNPKRVSSGDYIIEKITNIINK